MSTHKILYNKQFGFREGCGTEESVVNVINFICGSLDNGYSGAAAVFYDFTKAFDLIDHTILLEKLKFYGILGTELDLFKSYLGNRKQFVQIKDSKSSLKDVEYGVPQGSVLGPLLFSIYLNDIKNLPLTGNLFIYADDICIFYPFKQESVAKVCIEKDVATISKFIRINKLLLNTTKTRLMRFRPYNDNTKFSIFIDGKEVVEVDTVKYLGVYLQRNLSWNVHIRNLKTRASQVLGLIYKFNTEIKLLLYNALIQSKFNYLAIIYGYKKSTELKALQRMQNKALKVVANLPMTYPTVSLYKNVFKNTLPIYGIYIKQLLIYVFKCLRNIGHHIIKLSTNQIAYNTRNNNNLAVALCRLEITKQRVEFMGCREFNNLPQQLKSIDKISVFKRNLKKYLFENIEELFA